MSYRIICPYCFREFLDHEVHFRSERVILDKEKDQTNPLPEEFLDVDHFKASYTGSDKEAILRKIQEWEFFQARKDPVYEDFWDDFSKTTEVDPSDLQLGVKAYERPIIDPHDAAHQRYLRSQGQDYLIRDSQGMVVQVELTNGDKCSRRVCPHCHNPLPTNYGKNKVKFTCVIGITGAGKTIYLSQLLKGMVNYAAKAGLAAMVSNVNARRFVEENLIAPGHMLPTSTEVERFQQPLFYDLVRDSPEEGHVTETFVLYDVAGEVFQKGPEMIQRVAPFIEHADGIILLLDPLQIDAFVNAGTDGQHRDAPTLALESIHNIVTHGVGTEKCNIPFAVCISKADMPSVQSVLGPELGPLLRDDVHGIRGARVYQPIFNATEYNRIARGLDDFFMAHESALAQILETNYTNFNFFAFTALNCAVEETTDASGATISAPVGPVLPRRIEEPLFWMFYKLGYIDSDISVFRDVSCPYCGGIHVHMLPEDQRVLEIPGGFLRRKQYIPVDHVCENPQCLQPFLHQGT